jgi:hypothetical protein
MAKHPGRLRSKANARHQAAYRDRHLGQGEAARLNFVVNVPAKRSLERLARHFGITQREAFERLITGAEGRVVAKLDAAAAKRYYGD